MLGASLIVVCALASSIGAYGLTCSEYEAKGCKYMGLGITGYCSSGRRTSTHGYYLVAGNLG